MASKKISKKAATTRSAKPLAIPGKWISHGVRVREDQNNGRIEVDFAGRDNVVIFENRSEAYRALHIALILCGG